MLDSLWQIISHTPWWVFLLLALLLRIGIKATKRRVMPVRRLFILPAVFTLISIQSLIFAPIPLATYAVTLSLGLWIGYQMVKRSNLRIDRERRLLEIPGTWTTLILSLTIFGAKYYFGYSLASNPLLARDALFCSAMLAVSGLSTGIFVGRLLSFLHRLYHDAAVSLTQ